MVLPIYYMLKVLVSCTKAELVLGEIAPHAASCPDLYCLFYIRSKVPCFQQICNPKSGRLRALAHMAVVQKYLQHFVVKNNTENNLYYGTQFC